MLEASVVRLSLSPWGFAVVIVTKKDGKPRFFVDFRPLKKRTKADKWPLPIPEDVIIIMQPVERYSPASIFSPDTGTSGFRRSCRR